MQVLVITTSRRDPWFRGTRSSVLEQHPEAEVLAVLCDGRPVDAREDDVRLVDVELGGPGIAGADCRAVDLILGLGGRAAGWAALPWVLDAAGVAGPVLVLADTFVAHGSLDAMLTAAEHSGAAARARHLDAATGLGWGGCLPGALALGASDAELMSWWRARLGALLASDADHPVDALWRDLPVGSAVTPLADPGLRFGAATSGEIELELVAGEVQTGHVPGGGPADRVAVTGPDGIEPLRLVDMDGLDPHQPWWFALHGQRPQRYASESPVLRTLLHQEAARVLANGWTAPDPGRSFGGSDPGDGDTAVPGVAEPPELRRWFRSMLCAGGPPPPNPYVLGQVGEYLDLLAAPDPAGTTGISVHADLVMAARPDLANAFPAVRWSDRDRMVRWMWTHGLGEGQTSLALLPDMPGPRPVVTAVDERRPFGVNLVGYLAGDLGLGVAARRMKAALEAAGVPVATVTYDRTSSRMSGATSRTLDAPYLFNLIVITPDQLPYFVADVGTEFLAGHHNIGLWYWETDVLTPRQLSSFAWVDEVWGATSYLCDVFAAAGRVPVTHVPVPLVFEDPRATDADRARLGLDDRFTVLFSFDFLSVVDRKNPLGLIEAYRNAFEPGDGARLILKGINGDEFPDKREELFDAAADRPDIDVWDRYLSSRDRLALVQLVDCYASLHRSEGLGLTMAEAMALGTPVVATAYSGNLDFMDERSALLVPATEVLIGPGQLYPADGHWAEPDLDVAAAYLRGLRDDPGLGAQLVAAGHERLRAFDVATVGDVAARRLGELGHSS